MSPFLLEGEYVLVYDLQISIAALEFTHDMYAFFYVAAFKTSQHYWV